MKVDAVASAVLGRRAVTTIKVDHWPSYGFEAGETIMVRRTGECMTIVAARPEKNEIDVWRTPRG